MRSLIRSLCHPAAAALIALSLAVPAGAQGPSIQAASPTAPRVSIDNFGQVNEHYYRGAQPQGRDYADLAALGIRTVIDLQEDGDPQEGQWVERAGMTFYRIPMTTRVVPTHENLTRFLELVNEAANQPVYVHCAGGRHRTGVMTAVYRMTHHGWTAEQAFREMKQFRFGADFLHPEFKRFVYAFQPDSFLGKAAVATKE